jgi:alpha-L-fucosidase 2
MKTKITALLFLLTKMALSARETNFAAVNDVTWNSPGTNENDSMPLGNGDLALNAWTEGTGDIVLLLAKSDAWSENGQLLKLGRVHVKLTPNPFIPSATFTQTLRLETGEIQIQNGKNIARIWVDANRPVIHLEIESTRPVQLEAKSESWRTNTYHLDREAVTQAGFFEWRNSPDGLTFDPDSIIPARNNQVSWCHFNSHSIYPAVFEHEHLESLLPKYPDPLLHRCFGVSMKGPGLISSDDLMLKSKRASKSLRLDLYALTRPTANPEAWQAALNKESETIDRINIKTARKAHQEWWNEFWNRSWIHVSGTPEAGQVSQSYAMQRYMTACAGRGAQPIKFNGSLFTVGHDLPEGKSSTKDNHDPDFRAWGNSFWNQNTRLIYWPLIATGDNDLLTPWFNMYVRALPLATDRTRLYFHHDGGAFIETIYFWGLPNLTDFGWDNKGPELQSSFMRYHIQGGLEVLAQMLDYYDYNQDADFAKNALLPMANTLIPFYDQHWKRGSDGKILMEPSQALETYQKDVVNPTPDVAGLMGVLPRLLSLPSGLTDETHRTLWSKVLNDTPPLPMGTTATNKLPTRSQGGDPNGKRVIFPAQKYSPQNNHENPELYAIFPYALYGVGKSDLAMARDTYAARRNPFGKCWGQDGIQSALLGLTDDAKKVVLQESTSYGNQRFSWFWLKNSDWIPDMDNGGAGMMTLQLMLMQCDGKRIQLLPAWPDDWIVDFKLHAPYQTTVEAHIEHGKVSGLKVISHGPAKDIVVLP